MRSSVGFEGPPLEALKTQRHWNLRVLLRQREICQAHGCLGGDSTCSISRSHPSQWHCWDPWCHNAIPQRYAPTAWKCKGKNMVIGSAVCKCVHTKMEVSLTYGRDVAEAKPGLSPVLAALLSEASWFNCPSVPSGAVKHPSGRPQSMWRKLSSCAKSCINFCPSP